nr:alpha-galactosidase [uncultured Dubosiella sp.]
MNKFTDKLMEKIGPFAEMVSTNKYLCSLRDSFMVAFPATMFASIAIIIQYLPATFGLEGITPQWLLDFLNNFFDPIGNATMALGALFGVYGIVYSFAGHIKGNPLFSDIIAMTSFLIMLPFGSDPEGAFIPLRYLGTQGMFIAIITAFLATKIFTYLENKDFTIKMPDQVPTGIACSFLAIIPGAATLLVFNIICYVFTFTAYGNAFDCFVVDDGWFGKRDTDRSSLGDWFCDREKFPQGLGAFAEKIHQTGMQLGLWLEPEMVNEDSVFYGSHPEFVVRPPHGRHSYGRGQLVLDFANPVCVEAIWKQMKQVIVETKLDYIKWDMNRDITEAYSPYLAEKGILQKEFYYRYMRGVYSLPAGISEEFPEILIEGCALAYPMSCMSNHISAVPNDQTFRTTSLLLREQVAMFGILGLELDLCRCTEEEKDQLKEAIVCYKKLQPMIFDATLDVQRTPEGIWCWTAVSGDHTKYVTGFYMGTGSLKSGRNARVSVPHVDGGGRYMVNGQIINGSVIKHGGLRVPVRFNGANGEMAVLKGDYCSALSWMERLEEETQ